MLSPRRQNNPWRRTVAYFIFVLQIVGLLAIFGIALGVPGGSAANGTAFSFAAKMAKSIAGGGPGYRQNAAIPIRLKTKHAPAVRNCP